jgi:hypothetical protein
VDTLNTGHNSNKEDTNHLNEEDMRHQTRFASPIPVLIPNLECLSLSPHPSQDQRIILPISSHDHHTRLLFHNSLNLLNRPVGNLSDPASEVGSNPCLI